MERHRRDQVAVRQKVDAGVFEHATEDSRDIGAVGMLETKDQAAGAVVVAKGGARTLERWRLRGASAANRQIDAGLVAADSRKAGKGARQGR